MADAKHPECEDAQTMRIDLAIEAHVPDYLHNELQSPSWEWRETFCTITANHIRIYTAGLFIINTATLIYYRSPRNVLFAGVINPSTGVLSSADVTCEFKEDICEILVDLAASQLAGDIESFNQYSRNTQNADKHN